MAVHQFEILHLSAVDSNRQGVFISLPSKSAVICETPRQLYEQVCIKAIQGGISSYSTPLSEVVVSLVSSKLNGNTVQDHHADCELVVASSDSSRRSSSAAFCSKCAWPSKLPPFIEFCIPYGARLNASYAASFYTWLLLHRFDVQSLVRIWPGSWCN